MTRRLIPIWLILTVAIAAGGCAASRAYRQGNEALRLGQADQAVAYYRVAVQSDPDNASYKIALERAMVTASREHIERAQKYEEQDQLDAARSEYRLAAEYDPSNQTAAAKVTTLEQTIRARNEAARPPSPIEALRAQARAAAQPPVLNPVTDIVDLRFATNTNLRDVLSFLADQSGISIVYDRDALNAMGNQATSADLRGVTVEEALRQLLTYNGYTYKVLSERSILIFQDNTQKHSQYDDQVVQTFYLSHADATELSQLISSVMRVPGMAVIPMIQPNKTGNTLIVRGTRPVVEIIERLVAQNDKPRAEIVFDIEILEVDRNRVKNYGLNLSEYAVGVIFSPEVSPTVTVVPGTGGTPGNNTSNTNTGRSTSPSAIVPPPVFNLNTISRGVSAADWYMAVPTAIVRFLESDTNTKIVAKPQLRGTEGAKLTMNLGSEVPVITTSYTPIATGGAGVNPLNSVQYRPVGINVEIAAALFARGRHPDRDDAREQRARGERLGGRHRLSDVRLAPGHHQAPPSGRRSEPAGRPAARGRTQIVERVSRRDPRADPEAAVLEQRRDDSADRHRDAPDAAHHPDAGHHRGRPAAGLHRNAGEHRTRRAASDHLAAGRSAGGWCRGRGLRRQPARVPSRHRQVLRRADSFRRSRRV